MIKKYFCIFIQGRDDSAVPWDEWGEPEPWDIYDTKAEAQAAMPVVKYIMLNNWGHASKIRVFIKEVDKAFVDWCG